MTLGGLQFSDDTAQVIAISTVNQLNLTGALTGAATLNWKSGSIVMNNTSIVESSYTGALTLEKGYWQWGNCNGSTVNANTSVPALGASVTVKAGAQLTIHPWTTGVQSAGVNDKVKFTAPLVLAGGTVYCNDGSYTFSSVRVDSASGLKQRWCGKGTVIDRLFGAGPLTFTHNPNDDGATTKIGYLVVLNTNDGAATPTHFTGTMKIVESGTGDYNVRFYSLSTGGFNQAKIDLGVRTAFRLDQASSAGALVGAGTVESGATGTERTLSIGGYTPAENETIGEFSGTISGDICLAFGADNAVLKLTGTLGAVTTDTETSVTTAEYGKDLPIRKGSVLSLGLSTPTTISGILSGMGALEIIGGTQTLTAANTYTGGTTVTAGTLKFSGAGGVAGGNYTVDNGATLDLNGAVDQTINVVLNAGGALANTGNAIGTSTMQTTSLTLNGDAYVNAVSNFALLASGYGDTTLTLNGHTLTKKGTGSFTLCNTTIDGGTIKIEDGSVAFLNDSDPADGDDGYTTVSGELVFATDSTTAKTVSGPLSMGEGASLKKDGTGIINWTATLRGSVRPITVEAGTLQLASSVTTAIDDKGNTEEFILPEKTEVTVESGATLEIAKDNTVSWATIKGAGTLKVSVASYTFGFSGAFANTLETSLDIGKDSALIFRPWANATLKVPTLSVNGTLKKDGGNSTVGVTIDNGNTLKGSGTIEIATTFANGATLDATAETPLTISGAVAVNGALTVELADAPAEKASTTVLAKTNGEITLPEATNAFYLVTETELEDKTVKRTRLAADYLVLEAASDTGLVVKRKTATEGDAPIVVPSKDAQKAIATAATTAGVTELIEVKIVRADGTDAPATASADAAALFSNVLTVTKPTADATTGTATIKYDFGVERMTVAKGTDGNSYVFLLASVKNASENSTADFVGDTKLSVEGYNDTPSSTHGKAINTLWPGEYLKDGNLRPGYKLIAIPLSEFTGVSHNLRIKASKASN